MARELLIIPSASCLSELWIWPAARIGTCTRYHSKKRTPAGNVVDVGEVMQKIAEHKGCGTSGGSGKASCGSAAGQGDLPTEIWEKVKNHPCYSEEAHHHYARMHVAVAPACNIQCNYCNRKYDCANESRPGVVSEKLTPEQAAKKVLAVASTIPQMTVLGIAGPGDPLANPEKTFKTFELIAEDRARHQALPVDQRAGAARSRRHHRRLQRRSRHHHHQHGRSRDRREDLSLDVLEAQALHRRRSREAPDRPSAAGPRNAHRARHSLQGQLGDDPRRQRQAPGRGQQGGEVARRLPAQHHAADLRARARHRVRPDRPARPDGAGAEGAAGLPAKAR